MIALQPIQPTLKEQNFRVQTLEPRICATPNVSIGIHDLLHFFEAKMDFYEATLECTNKWSHWFQQVHRAHKTENVPKASHCVSQSIG